MEIVFLISIQKKKEPFFEINFKLSFIEFKDDYETQISKDIL